VSSVAASDTRQGRYGPISGSFDATADGTFAVCGRLRSNAPSRPTWRGRRVIELTGDGKSMEEQGEAMSHEFHQWRSPQNA